MTLKELNSLIFLEQEIDEYKKKILELREMAESVTANYSGMPRAGGTGNKIENAVIAIISYQEMLDNAICEKVEQTKRIHEYIMGVEDAQTRQIMFLRFIQRKPWSEVARKIGGRNTASAVRNRIIRYIESCTKCTPEG